MQTSISPSGFQLNPSLRFTFNGMEKDDEVKGVGNSYTTLFRAYDPRLGRWLSLDPKSVETPWQSPYAGMDNNPIRFNDPLGDKVRNKHESDRNTSKNKMDVAEKNLNSYSGNKSSKEFKKLEKEYKKLERNYNKIVRDSAGGAR